MSYFRIRNSAQVYVLIINFSYYVLSVAKNTDIILEAAAFGSRRPSTFNVPTSKRKFGQRLAAVTGAQETAAKELSDAKPQFNLAALAHALAAVPLPPVTTACRSLHACHRRLQVCVTYHMSTSRHIMPKFSLFV
jgi:hypothetical protein